MFLPCLRSSNALTMTGPSNATPGLGRVVSFTSSRVHWPLVLRHVRYQLDRWPEEICPFCPVQQTLWQFVRHSGKADLWNVSNRAGVTASSKLTSRDHNPNEIHEEIVEPKVIRLGSAVLDIAVVVVEHGCAVV